MYVLGVGQCLVSCVASSVSPSVRLYHMFGCSVYHWSVFVLCFIIRVMVGSVASMSKVWLFVACIIASGILVLFPVCASSMISVFDGVHNTLGVCSCM